MDDDWGGPLAQADLNNELFFFLWTRGLVIKND